MGSTAEFSGIQNYIMSSGANCLGSEDFSKFMDNNDPLGKFRAEFLIPKVKNIVNEITGEIKDSIRVIFFWRILFHAVFINMNANDLKMLFGIYIRLFYYRRSKRRQGFHLLMRKFTGTTM